MASISATAPLRVRRFRWYFASRSINLIGNTMAPVALAFAVLGLDGSPMALAGVLAARTVPLVVFLLVGGVIADRWGRATVILGSNVVSGLSQAATAALLLSGSAHLWELVVLAAVNGTAAAAGTPAMNGLMPQLVPQSMLQEANALTSLTRAVLAILGPTLGGVFVVTVGAGWALGLDALTWLAAAALVVPVRVPIGPGSTRAPMLAELRDGWEFFRSTTWLWTIVGAFAILNALYEGAFITLGPVRAAATSLGAHGWGLLLSAQGVGVLVATLALMRWRLERPLVFGMLGCALFGLPILMLGATTSLAPLLVAGFVSGLGIQTYSLAWSLALQEHIPGHLLSRASSYDSLGSFAAIPVGQLVLGRLGQQYGVAEVILVAGACYIAVSLLTLVSPTVREMARVPAPAQAG